MQKVNKKHFEKVLKILMRLYEMEKQGVCKKHFKKMLKRSMQLYEME
jgi:hypothetical protein